jgi:hypothetical protein
MLFGRVCGEHLDDEGSDNERNRSIMNDTREIRIPADLCDAAVKKFAGAFHNVDELVTFLLQELVHGDTLDLDRADQAAVEQRLRDLGYM